MTEGWGGQVAECLFLRAARIGAVNGPDTHDAPHGDLDELHRLVSARLASDPALAQLEREAAAGIESERTKRRVRDAVEQALEDDQGFADELTQAVGTLSSAGGGRQPSFSKPASEPREPSIRSTWCRCFLGACESEVAAG